MNLHALFYHEHALYFLPLCFFPSLREEKLGFNEENIHIDEESILFDEESIGYNEKKLLGVDFPVFGLGRRKKVI